MSTQRSDSRTKDPRARRALALACVPGFMVGLDALVVTIALARGCRNIGAVCRV